MAILAGTTSVSGKGTGIIAATMLFLFNFFFAVGLLAIPWLLPSEYSPTPIRSASAALGSASNWIVSQSNSQPLHKSLTAHSSLSLLVQFTFLVVEITPVSIKTIGYRTYIYFAVFNACFIPLIYFYYPESARLTLEEIDFLFTGEKVLLHMPEVGDPREVVVTVRSSLDVVDYLSRVCMVVDMVLKGPSLRDSTNPPILTIRPSLNTSRVDKTERRERERGYTTCITIYFLFNRIQ